MQFDEVTTEDDKRHARQRWELHDSGTLHGDVTKCTKPRLRVTFNGCITAELNAGELREIADFMEQA